jgi:hypothetical protein
LKDSYLPLASKKHIESSSHFSGQTNLKILSLALPQLLYHIRVAFKILFSFFGLERKFIKEKEYKGHSQDS